MNEWLGKPVADAMTADLTARTEALKARGVTPTLAVVRVGEKEEDLAYEREMAEFNEKSLPGYRTELLRCPDELCAISSTEVRRRLAAGEDISSLVPKETLEILSQMR